MRPRASGQPPVWLPRITGTDESLRIDVEHLPGALVTAAASMAPLQDIAHELTLEAHARVVQDGDLALFRVSDENTFRSMQVQDSSGRRMSIYGGDLLIGVLGARESPSHVLGELPRKLVEPGARLHLLSDAGVVGALLFAADQQPVALELCGLLAWKRTAANLSRWRGRPPGLCTLPPVILIVGTATGIGKTTLTCRLIHTLVHDHGELVGSIMLSGSGGKDDALAYRAAGARFTHSFIEAGLGTSYSCPPREFVGLVDGICHRMAAEERPSIIVGELGGRLLVRWRRSRAAGE